MSLAPPKNSSSSPPNLSGSTLSNHKNHRELSSAERSRSQIQQILQEIPLVVLADDQAIIRNVVSRMIAETRGGVDKTVKLGGDLHDCFDRLSSMKEEKLPIIECHNGVEARGATQIVIDRDVKGSLLFFDHDMHPEHKGLKLFREYHDYLPVGTTRILYSGDLPRDHKKYIKKGILDGVIPKFASDFDRLPELIAAACLNRNIRTVFGNRSK